MSKKIILVALAMVVALALVGCTAENSLGGTMWRAVDGTKMPTGETRYTQYSFDKDKTLKTAHVDSNGNESSKYPASYSDKWEATGNDLTMTLGSRTVKYTTKISGKKMTMTAEDGTSTEWTKV